MRVAHRAAGAPSASATRSASASSARAAGRLGRRATTIGAPVVAALMHARIERDLAEQRQLQLVGQALAAARAEERRRLAAVRALEPAHVLDDAEHRHADALEHLRAAQRVADATSCGVVTMTAPCTCVACTSESWASPVPGGMSTRK